MTLVQQTGNRVGTALVNEGMKARIHIMSTYTPCTLGRTELKAYLRLICTPSVV